MIKSQITQTAYCQLPTANCELVNASYVGMTATPFIRIPTSQPNPEPQPQPGEAITWRSHNLA